MLLRTHTSPVQVRTMMDAAARRCGSSRPGRVYRSDSDATHTPMFHQVEGLVIDRGIHLGHLKWTLETFLKAFFERDDIVLRLRPSYFPFTEPSVEVDVGFALENGRRVLGGDGDAPGHGWMELLGSGMVNRRVIEMCGLDPDEWQGFAFGVGVDRLAMLKYGMDDLRAFFDGDVRWLRALRLLARSTCRRCPAGVGATGMKFSLSWLKDLPRHRRHASPRSRPSSTRIGLEVEGIDDPAEKLAGFRVAEVLTAAPHPDADKLQVLTVDTRRRASRCRSSAARPMRAPGMIGVLGLPGAVVPANGMELKQVARSAGVESNGMMCSTRELELGDEHDGIIELPADAPVGTAFADYHGAESGVRRRDHPQPARLHGRLRHRPRPRGGGAGHAQAAARRADRRAVSPARSKSAPTIPKAARRSTAA